MSDMEKLPMRWPEESTTAIALKLVQARVIICNRIQAGVIHMQSYTGRGNSHAIVYRQG